MMSELAAIGAWFFVNFDLTLFLIAVAFIIIHRGRNEKITNANIVYPWIVFFSVAIPFMYAFVIHNWFSFFAVVNMGYTPNPYHLEIAFIDLFFAIAALAAIKARYAYRMGIAFLCAFIMWTDLASHLYEIIKLHQFTIGNVGSSLFLDLMVPIILITSSWKLIPK